MHLGTFSIIPETTASADRGRQSYIAYIVSRTSFIAEVGCMWRSKRPIRIRRTAVSEVAYLRHVLVFVGLRVEGIDAGARAGSRVPRVRFSRPGDGGGALHNCATALRARSRSERPPRARHTRKHAHRRALYVTRDHRALSRDSSTLARKDKVWSDTQ